VELIHLPIPRFFRKVDSILLLYSEQVRLEAINLGDILLQKRVGVHAPIYFGFILDKIGAKCIIESRKRFLEIGTGGGYRCNDAGFLLPSESWRRSVSLDSLEVLSILLVLYKTD
jgi:hypothetical protein